MDDRSLLREYVERGSHQAFSGLLQRYLPIVYAAARRQVGSDALAEDVTQAVFIILARKAAQIRMESSISGWLLNTTYYAARDAIKIERRRRHHEKRAAQMARNRQTHVASAPSESLLSVLDAALVWLGQKDRDAVAWHYVEDRSIREIADVLGVSEDAAGKRVRRAMEKLRRFFAAHGVATTSTAITAALAAGSGIAVPASLGGSVAAAALAGTTAETLAAAGIAKGAILMMVMAKLKAAAIAAIIVLLAGFGAVAIHEIAAAPPATAPVAPTRRQTISAAAPDSGLPSVPIDCFQGVVLDPDGRPIADAPLRLRTTLYDQTIPAPDATAKTSVNGRFSFDPLASIPDRRGYRTVVIDHPRYALGWRQPLWSKDEAPIELEIRLGRPTTVAGTIGDRAGVPVAGATVEASLQSADFNYLNSGDAKSLLTTTDANGRFEFSRIPEGTRLHLYVKHRLFAQYTTQEGYRGDVFPVRAGDQQVRASLEPGAIIHGHMTRGGKPLEQSGLRIRAVRSSGSPSIMATTDEKGQFELSSLAAGSYCVLVDPYTRPYADEFGELKQGVEVKAGQVLEGLELRCVPGVPLTGTVADSLTGRGTAGTSVEAGLRSAPGCFAISAASDANGRYELSLPPGNYELYAMSWNALHNQYDQVIEPVDVLDGHASRQVNFSIGVRPQIRGRLLDAAGKPLQGLVSFGWETAKTDTQGRYSLPAPGSGSERVGLAWDRAAKLGKAFVWEDGELPGNLDIKLEPMAAIAGTLVGKSGLPLVQPKLWVYVGPVTNCRILDRQPLQVETRPDGSFTIRSIPLGTETRLRIEAPGFLKHMDLKGLVLGQTLQLGQVTVNPTETQEGGGATDWTAKLGGRVVDENGEPRKGATVAVSLSGTERRDVTDQHGEFHLAGLPAGRNLRVNVYDFDYGFEQPVEIEAGREDLELKITPPGHGLIGKPAPELQVEEWVDVQPVKLSDLRGKVILLQLALKLHQFPDFGREVLNMADKYGPEGLVVIGVVDEVPAAIGRAKTGWVRSEAQKKGITYPLAIDAMVPDPARKGFVVDATYLAYGAKTPFQRYVIDKKGMLRAAPTAEELEKWIIRLLDE